MIPIWFREKEIALSQVNSDFNEKELWIMSDLNCLDLIKQPWL